MSAEPFRLSLLPGMGGLRRKLSLLVFLAVTFPLFWVGWYGYDTTARLLTERARALDGRLLEEVADDLMDQLERVPRDLGFLADYHALQHYLMWDDLGEIHQSLVWRGYAHEGLASFLESRGIYGQLQVIGLDGEEKIRVVYRPEHQHAVALAPRKGRGYRHRSLFERSGQMFRGQIFAFPAGLNRDLDDETATMHFASPLLDGEGRLRGLVTLDLFAGELLAQVAEQDGKGEEGIRLFLLEAEHGHYLYHGERERRWGDDLLGRAGLAEEQPELFKAVIEEPRGTRIGDGVFSSFQRVELPWLDEKDHWVLLSVRDEAVALAPLRRFEVVFAGVLLGSLLLVLLIGHRFIGGILGPLRGATDTLKRLAEGSTVEDEIRYRADDEIGELVAAARDLNRSISGTIQQANAVAAGDYDHEVALRSENDQLGVALRRMIHSLRETTTIAKAVAEGDFSRSMVVRGDNDRLGHAINRMTGNLDTVAEIAEAAANGDYSRTMTVSGEGDRLSRSVNRMIDSFREVVAQANAISRGDYSTAVEPRSAHDELGMALARMTRELRDATAATARQDWVKSGQTRLNDLLRGDRDLGEITRETITFLVEYLGAHAGAFYVVDDEGRLKFDAGYSFSPGGGPVERFAFGEGVVGQAAREQHPIVLDPVPAGYLSIKSGLGEADSASVIVLPLVFNGKTRGVIELGSFLPFNEIHREFLESVDEGIAVALNTVRARLRMKELLEETQSQAEELQAQQEELRQANEELEERAEALELQREETRRKNEALERSRGELEEKARELALASKYKSEFLANMSHELRTPLNSLLILAQLLQENKEGNLTAKQQEFARTIHTAGSDLLELINDILDLSKVEAGKIELQPERLPLREVAGIIQRKFQHVADGRGLAFEVEVADGLPEEIVSDRQRLEQIVKNLLSNAFKFTSEGGVRLIIGRPDRAAVACGADPSRCLAFSVSDSGIGIPAEKQKLIFEAFQQADGSTNRRYGGTGLGLSISRELAALLGGELQLVSEEGKGSTFTLVVPERIAGAAADAPPLDMGRAPAEEGPPAESPAPAPASADSEPAVADDRADMSPGSRSLLIVEDDANFARVLLELARERGFLGLVAESGEAALHLADYYRPSAVLLDIGLPGMDGWTVMQRLKDNPETRHIPVHFISGRDQELDARRMGAVGFLIKPAGLGELSGAFTRLERFAGRRARDVVVVGGDESRRKRIGTLVGQGGVEVRCAGDFEAATAAIEQGVDCVVFDLDDDRGGTVLRLLDWMDLEERRAQTPVILYADRELTGEEEAGVARHADKMIVKEVQSPERLLDEVVLFLHQIEAELPEEQREMIRRVHDKASILHGRKILLVDDDMRNVYALAATLEEHGVVVEVASNGRVGIDQLEANPDTDLVLMDIMMPEMDGYEAMRRIRKQERFKNLPIIALTAKAMKGDKAKCIEAGASDYLAKPVDIAKLLSMLRVWLYR